MENIRELVDNNRQVNRSDNRVVVYFFIHRSGTGVASCRWVKYSIKGEWSLVNFKVLVKRLWKLYFNWSLAHFQVTGVLPL